MMRIELALLLGCLTVECALAQSSANELSLYTVQGNVETPVVASYLISGQWPMVTLRMSCSACAIRERSIPTI